MGEYLGLLQCQCDIVVDVGCQENVIHLMTCSVGFITTWKFNLSHHCYFMDLLFHLQDVLLHVGSSYCGVIRTLKGKLKYASLVTQHPLLSTPWPRPWQCVLLCFCNSTSHCFHLISYCCCCAAVAAAGAGKSCHFPPKLDWSYVAMSCAVPVAAAAVTTTAAAAPRGFINALHVVAENDDKSAFCRRKLRLICCYGGLL